MPAYTLSHGLLDFAGQPLVDTDGQPLTMHAVCQQVTAQVAAMILSPDATEAERSLFRDKRRVYALAARFQGDGHVPVTLSIYEAALLLDMLHYFTNSLVLGRIQIVLDA